MWRWKEVSLARHLPSAAWLSGYHVSSQPTDWCWYQMWHVAFTLYAHYSPPLQENCGRVHLCLWRHYWCFFFQGAVEVFPSVFVFSVATATKTNYFTRGWTISTLVVACKPKLSIRHSVEERENEKIQRRQMESCNSFGEVDMTNTYPADWV